MLKRILFPSLLLYGVLTVLLAASLMRAMVKPSPRPRISYPPVSATSQPTPSPTGKPELWINATVKRNTSRHFTLELSVEATQEAALDAFDISLFTPLESVELTKITPDLITLCPKAARQGNYLDVTCSSDSDSGISSSPKKFLTVDIMLRSPYRQETVAVNPAKSSFYHNGRLIPSGFRVTEFTLKEP